MTIRTLRHGDEIPTHRPRRYLNASGYVRLRWRLGSGEYVEAYEHRVVMGLPPDDKHVHHINHDRTDNRPQNLEILDADEHLRHHGDHARTVDYEAAEKLYRQGASLPQISRRLGADTGNLSRQLRLRGVRMRTKADYATQVDRNLVVFLHEREVRAPYIAEHLGVSVSAVRRTIRSLGLPRLRSGAGDHAAHARHVIAELQRKAA